MRSNLPCACLNTPSSLPPPLPPFLPQLTIPADRTPAILALNALCRTRPTHTHMPARQYGQLPLIRQTYHTFHAVHPLLHLFFLSSSTSTSTAIVTLPTALAVAPTACCGHRPSNAIYILQHKNAVGRLKKDGGKGRWKEKEKEGEKENYGPQVMKKQIWHVQPLYRPSLRTYIPQFSASPPALPTRPPFLLLLHYFLLLLFL